MSWTTPFTWTTGHVVTAAEMNTYNRDNLRYLKGLDGAVTIEADLTVDNLITSGNVDGVDVGDHVANTTTVHGAVSTATASKFVVRDGSARAKFGAPNASGDALIKGTRVTVTELPAMTDEFYWVGTGANVEERAAPTAATKEFFAPAHRGTDPRLVGDSVVVRIDSSGDDAFISFFVPSDFTTLTAIVLVVFSGSTATHRLNFFSDYGAIGQGYQTHNETESDVDTALTDSQLTEIDISGVFASLATGDYCGFRALGDSTNVPNLDVVGIRLKYA